MIVAAIIAALLVGYLAGLLSFKVKNRWCEVCGATLTCPDFGDHDRLIQARAEWHA